MIVSDNNALNSYLKTPPYFGGGERGVNSVFEIAPARTVPSVIQDRETEQEVRWAEQQRRGTEDRHRDRQDLRSDRNLPHPGRRGSLVYTGLPELRLARPGQIEVDARLSNQAQIRTQLAHSGYLPRQMVIAGGHTFDTTTQARATFNASKVHQQRERGDRRNSPD